MDTEHFQALFRVITLGRIQIENNQIEKSSTKELTAWLLSKLHVIRHLKYRLKMIIQYRLSVFKNQAVNVAKQL